MRLYHLMADDVLQILLELFKRNVLASWTRSQAGIIGSKENNLRLSKQTSRHGEPIITIMWTEACFSLGMKSGKTFRAIAVLYPLPHQFASLSGSGLFGFT